MLNIQNVSFAYDKQLVLENINFTIEQGQHIALIGASGCGKSTLLKIIYGLLHIDQGNLSWNNKKILGPNYHLIPGEESMKYLSQGFELLPHRTVSENISHFLSNMEQSLKNGRVQELLEIVEMATFADTNVENLSGGQKQRVALAKALAKKPELLLLDEPFGNIDNFRRSSLRRNLFSYLTRNKITSITATHDKTDILSFADETIVLQQGKLLSKENTQQLYINPKNYYIASLFGEVNQLNSNLFDASLDDNKKVLIYPHELTINQDSPIKVKVKKSHFQGNGYLVEAILDNQIIFLEHSTYFSQKEEIGIQIPGKILKSRIKESTY